MIESHLFQGKRIDNGEWVIGNLHSIHGFTLIYDDDCGEWQEIDPATIRRCTGLSDGKGTLIFEGDICKDSLDWVFEVLWDRENARFIGRQSKPRGDAYICYVSRVPSVEIIGNIHDNPELLSVSESDTEGGA